MPTTPRAEAESRRAVRSAEAERLGAQHRRIARVRLAVFLAGVAIAWLALDRAAISAWWIAVPVVGFAALVAVHVRVGDALERARIAVRLYDDVLARIDDRWVGRGAPGDAYRDPAHPYAEDLDVFGRGSLFERISTARTRAGEATLAGWLGGAVAARDPQAIRARQAAVAELAPLLDLREDLAIAAADAAGPADTERVRAWGAAPATGPSWAAALAAGAASLATLAAVVAGLAFDLGATPFFAAVAVQAAIEASQRRRVAAALAGIAGAARTLERIAALLARAEREPFAAPRLRALAGELASEGQSASRAIRGLRRRIELLDSARNFMFAPIALWLSWRLHLARWIGEWRRRHGPRIADWIAALGEVEALVSLAAYAWERPEDVFPDVADGGPLAFAASGLGHPLLPAASCVRNDVSLVAPVRALMVSGSNMSGKSTLLRAVGTNAILAFAGAPVRAERLRLAPCAIGAVLRVNDSLLDGTSRFHAELLHLRRILDLAAHGPVLFLLDEILHGTNSHDRRIGAEAVVRALLARGAIGLVTTHDLALADMASEGSPIANVHFVDHLEDGRMRFDYRMHPGVVRRSNALALMRAVGIDV
ncbi:MAG TPA: DNA mismatch repair protein MutS [Candidatus Binatia bacterium]|nr:DNA mismatch repair protein MutS [Candidatus Binatia bacterium]